MPSQDLFTGGLEEPPPEAPAHLRLGWLLDVQARACALMGSSLYGDLLAAAAADARARGPLADLLAAHLGDGRSGALALRFLAAVHRLVLTGEVPALARHYPSVGGDGDAAAAWPVLRALVGERRAQMDELVRLPCQTNEVGRCAGLAWAFLAAASRTGLPLRLLEVGASAGLNLRWDQFRYGTATAGWGPTDSPVDLTGLWAETPPAGVGVAVAVAERRGCDPSPIDPLSPEGRVALRAPMWADQVERFARLDGALDVAARIPAVVDAAPVGRWLPDRLAERAGGQVTVVYHSVVEEYLDGAERAALHTAVAAAGQRATPDNPLAWVRLEPISALRHHGVTLELWPGGQLEVLAVCGAHGTDVRRPAADGTPLG